MRFLLLISILLLTQTPLTLSQDIIAFLNALLKTNLPHINTAIQGAIPTSYGNCNDNGPPSPCGCSSGCSNLYNIHKPWEYKAFARWITGLRSGHLTSVEFSPAEGGVTVNIQGVFDQLSLSLWIGECFTFDQCSILWDNTDGCCGSNKHFRVDIAVNCQNPYPYLKNIRLVDLVLDQFEITEKIIGIPINLEDITNAISGVVTGLLTSYLTTERFIPYNGTTVTVLEFANAEIQSFTGGNFTCPTFLPEIWINDKKSD